MCRKELRSAVVVGLCLLLPLCAYGQTEVAKPTGASQKIAQFNNLSNQYANAVGRNDDQAALKHWEQMRVVARWLVQNGSPEYAKYDKDMPGGGGGGQQQSDPTSSDQVQPVTVDISDWLEVKAGCCKPVEMSINESQTGYPDDLTEVDVTVHGRVVDQTGMPVSKAVVRLADAGKSTETNDSGEFSLTFFTQGFDPVDLSGEVVVVCSCISVEAVAVGLGVIRPDSQTSNTFSIYNSCDTSVEVSMPSKPKDGLSFEIEDCSGGHTSLGSVVEGGGQNAQLGPGGRCTIKVEWAPGKEMMLDRPIAIPSITSLASKCDPKVRIVGAATWGIEVTPRDLRYEGVVEVGDRRSLMLRIVNLSQSNLTVRRFSFAGPHDTDFTATITSIDRGRLGNARDFLLTPGGSCDVRVNYSPKDDDVRLGTLVVRSTDPVAPRILVPLSGLAEHTISPPGTTSTIRQVPGSTSQP